VAAPPGGGAGQGAGPGAGPAAAPRARYGGELLRANRYEEWAEAHRDRLRHYQLDLLRLDGRWAAVAELDPGDERAHLALMRQHAARGDRHAALRQAAVALADGDPGTARARLPWAAGRYQRAGQPLDAGRCRRALASMTRAGHAGGANSSRATLSGSRNDRPESRVMCTEVRQTKAAGTEKILSRDRAAR
jgi:hypothetical protein